MDLDIFYSEVVSPFVRDFEQERSNMRAAYGAIWALDSFASHIFYAFRDIAELNYSNDIPFKNNLAKDCDDFALVMEVSAATKHAVSRKPDTKVQRASQVQNMDLNGWAGYFSGAHHDDWGEQIVINNANFLYRPLLPTILSAEQNLLNVQDRLAASLQTTPPSPATP